MSEACPVCGLQLDGKEEFPSGRDITTFSCPLCGEFSLSRTLVAVLPRLLLDSKDASPKLSHAIRQMQRVSKGAEVYTNTVQKILESPLPRPKEQADLLLRWIAENVEGPGEMVWIEPSTHRAIVGAKSDAGFKLVLDHLFQSGLITGNPSDTMNVVGHAEATPSFEGWEYYDGLQTGAVANRKAFMAMKFGDSVLDGIVNEIFRSAVRDTGFDLRRLDDVPQAGLIDDRLRVEIQSSAFVIADLTHDNLGAYWEAGYAEGIGKPVIYTCRVADERRVIAGKSDSSSKGVSRIEFLNRMTRCCCMLGRWQL